MYPVDEIIARMHESLALVLGAGAVAFLSYYAYYGEGIRLGRRDRTHAVPVFANMYFFAHDAIFVSLFRRWFYEVDHWLFKGFWAALLIFTALELIVHVQTLRFSLSELFPRLPRSQAIAAYIAMQIGIGILFWFIYNQIDDYLYLVSFGSAVIVSAVMMFPMLRLRQSRKGQSRVMAATTIVGPLGFFFLMLPVLSGYFLSLPFLLVGGATAITGILYFWRLGTYPESAPAP